MEASRSYPERQRNDSKFIALNCFEGATQLKPSNIVRSLRSLTERILQNFLGHLLILGFLSFYILRKYFSPLLTEEGAIFFISFYSLALILIASLSGVGLSLRKYFLAGIKFNWADLPLGFGIFCWFLSFYLKFTISPIVPIFFLGIGLFAFTRAYSKSLTVSVKTWIYGAKNASNLWIFLAIALLIIELSFGSGGYGGFLRFTHDFDSGLVHTTFPKTVHRYGHYFLPDWIRGLWIPQLTHYWYIFILSIGSELTFKISNIFCVVQILILFMQFRFQKNTYYISFIGLLFGVFLVGSPEFNSHISSTSLDAIFLFFSLTALAVFFDFISTPTYRKLALLTLFSGFMGGQKHFGLMYSVPFLSIAYLYFFIREIRIWKRSTPRFLLISFLFPLIFVPFYFHNIIADSSLFFPFMGGMQNGYFWSSREIEHMVHDVVGHWGRSKDFFGFFSLPLDIIRFPESYESSSGRGYWDYAVSVCLGSLSLMFFISSWFFWRKKSATSLTIFFSTLCILAQIIFWYRGSQVVRYLFPVWVSIVFLWKIIAEILLVRFGHISFLNFQKRSPLFVAATIITIFIIFSHPSKFSSAEKFSRTPLEIQKSLWNTGFKGIRALVWLDEHTSQTDKILEIAPGVMGLNQFFVQLNLRGDWFAKYRYERYIRNFSSTPSFHPLTRLKQEFREERFSYLLIQWDAFAKELRPKDDKRLDALAFDSDVKNCLALAFHGDDNVDVYSFKTECFMEN